MDKNKIIKIGDRIWSTQSELDKWSKLFRKWEKYIWFYMNKDTVKVSNKRRENRRNLRVCYIKIGNTRKRAMIDTKTMKAYKIKDYATATWIEWKNFTFIKWLQLHEA